MITEKNVKNIEILLHSFDTFYKTSLQKINTLNQADSWYYATIENKKTGNQKTITFTQKASYIAVYLELLTGFLIF